MLLRKTLDPIEIVPSSNEAIHFDEKIFQPFIRRTTQRIEHVPFCLFLWMPTKSNEHMYYLQEIKSFFLNLGVHVITPADIHSDQTDQTQNEDGMPSLPNLISTLKHEGQDFDALFAFLFENNSNHNELIKLRNEDEIRCPF
jgi:hypothetical protein